MRLPSALCYNISCKMNIAVDLTQIPADKTGMGIYAVNLVRELIRLNNNSKIFHFYFFVQDDDGEWIRLIEGGSQCRLIPIHAKIFRKLLFRFVFEQVLFPVKCKKLKIDIIYSFHYTMPYLTRIKRIVNIPDMTFYLFPGLHQKIKRLYFKSLIPLSLKKSHKIVTISESTKNDMLKRFKGLSPDKIEVIHLGVRPGNPPVRASQHLDRYGLSKNKYFLFLGTLEPRKNIVSIIKAFHQVITGDDRYRENYKLVIAGQKGWFYEKIFETVERLHLEESVVFTGYANEEVKQPLLANAYLFVYPSIYEGFGLPVLEAMAYGVPVITANVSSLPEVSGEAALLVRPGKWQDIAEAMQKLLSNKKLYENLSTESLARAKKFSWEQTAKKTLALFKSSPINN